MEAIKLVMASEVQMPKEPPVSFNLSNEAIL
jgi:hypothetical protein